VAQELNRTFGTKVSATDVSRVSESVIPAVDAWMSRPVPEGIRFLFLDALYLPVRKPGFTAKQALLAAIGVTDQGAKHVLGFVLGDRENHDSWSALIKDLLNRGLKRDALALVLSDDHKAIRSAVDHVLGIPHQLCVVHKMRNALARVSAPNRKEFYRDFTRIYWAKSKSLALVALGELRGRWQSVYPKAVDIATAESDQFLRFMDFPEPFWTTLRSTNLIERFIRELRRRLRPAGALPAENALWKLVWSVSVEQERRWARASRWQQPRVKPQAVAA
jgi:transposase-like protein